MPTTTMPAASNNQAPQMNRATELPAVKPTSRFGKKTKFIFGVVAVFTGTVGFAVGAMFVFPAWVTLSIVLATIASITYIVVSTIIDVGVNVQKVGVNVTNTLQTELKPRLDELKVDVKSEYKETKDMLVEFKKDVVQPMIKEATETFKQAGATFVETGKMAKSYNELMQLAPMLPGVVGATALIHAYCIEISPYLLVGVAGVAFTAWSYFNRASASSMEAPQAESFADPVVEPAVEEAALPSPVVSVMASKIVDGIFKTNHPEEEINILVVEPPVGSPKP